MALIEVEIEIDDYMDQIETKVLVKELMRRKGLPDNYRLGVEIAQRLRSAFYRHDGNQFEAILTAHLDPYEIKQEAA